MLLMRTTKTADQPQGSKIAMLKTHSCFFNVCSDFSDRPEMKDVCMICTEAHTFPLNVHTFLLNVEKVTVIVL